MTPGGDGALTEAEHDMLARARALVPALADRAAVTAAQRNVADETIADYHRAGVLRVLQPRRFGGHQLRFCLFSRIVEALTEGCASSAWVYAVFGEHQWIVASYPLQAQIDVWGDDALAVASSSLAPRSVASRAGGGWRLSGRYPFSSGCCHARWAIIGAFLGKDGDPRSVGYLLVPLSEIEIIDDWHVLGLAGTGSRSLRLDDVFVPDHRCVLLDDLHAGTPPGALVHPDYPVLRAPRGLLVNFSLPPVSIALGRRALDVALDALRGRVSRGVMRPAASEFVQVAVAEAAAAIDAATLTMWHGRDTAEALVANGPPFAAEAELRARRDMTHAQHQVQWAIERLAEVCGARSVYDADPLAAIRRDVLTLLTHVVASRQAAMGRWGRWALDAGQTPQGA